MKYILIASISFFLIACNNNEAFINHKLEYQSGGECTTGEKTINMLSNIAGERYQFECCLDNDFDGKAYHVDRKGDSIIVSFERKSNQQRSFSITLDIDAYPPYKQIVLDGKAIPIVRKE